MDEIDRPLEYVSINDRHSAATRLAATISDFLANAVIHKQAEDFVDRIFALQSRNEMLISLQDTLQSFVTTMQNTTCDDRSQIKVIIDSLHMLLIVLSETIQDENESSDLLLELTFDRGDMMEKLRLSMINNTYVDTAQRQSVFISSGIFERIVWLIRKITLSRYS